MPDLLVGGVILLYGDVGDPWGWGDGFTVQGVAEALVEHGPGPVTCRINSGGGVAFDGIAIYSLLKSHDGEVTIEVDGIAASAASLICMAADKLAIRQGAMLMIHDAAGVTFGNAAEHARTAEVLNKLSDQYAGIYAAKCGKSADECRALMKDETWLTADEAIASGLADLVVAEEPKETARFDYRLYAKTPETIKAALRPAPTRTPKAQSEDPMPNPVKTQPEDPALKTNPTPADPAPTAKAWAHDFYQLAARSGLTLAESNDLVAKADSEASAKNALIDFMAAKQAGNVPPPQAGRIEFGADARDKFIAGVSNAFLARENIEARDPKNEFNGMKPMDLIRAIAANHGIRASYDPMKLVAVVMTHSSGDFSNVTANIATKSMLKGYEETAESFTKWTSVGSLPDFKIARRVDLNAMPSLPAVNEQQEYQYLTTGDRGEIYSLATAGGLFSISRQAIINDDLDVFGRVPRKLGRAAKRTIGNDVYGVLTTNPTMGDGLALFHATHANLFSGGGTALSATSLQAGDLAMRLQKDRSQPKVVLNVRPRYLITPAALKYTGLQLIRSTAAIGQANPGVTNPVQNVVDEVIDEGRLDAASATAWYLAADQNTTDTVEVLYLNGVQEPMLEEYTQPNIDGLMYKVRIDYGVKAFGWEGMQKQLGV